MPGLHPFVQGLLKELPKAGDVWPEDQRKLWLDTAAGIFKMICKDKAAILPPPGDEEYQKRKTTFWNERGRQLRRSLNTYLVGFLVLDSLRLAA